MEYVRFGNTGMKVSRICLGCMSYGDPARDGWALNEEQSRPYIQLIGATKPHHLEDAVAALSVRLTPEEVQQLEEAYRPHPIIGFS